MSDPSPRSAGGLWSAVRDLLHLKQSASLRESIEEAIDEHLEESADPDDLDLDERTMLRNMLHLTEQHAGDIAVPRSDITAISKDSDFKAVVRQFLEAGHSRLPVYDGKLDSVLGMLHVKDVFAVIAERFGRRPGGPLPTLEDLLRPVLFVPPSMPVVDLLTEMRRKRTHMAIVVDEYGGTDGLVTIEDIVEEIVGEIEDEHDEEEAALLTKLPDGTIEADARLDLDDLEKAVGESFIDHDLGDEVDTLGGLSFLMAGRVPEVGEKLTHANGWTLEIASSDGRRVEKLLLHPPAPVGEEAAEA
ncbi:HlyC/CorC family transporter [Sandaracinobacter neustonicus]|uniref:HlyC/CorC family transporter n=1 Tax=Sandaracinobacter neustonicus TaxID=1715348 RepID=A0A501XTU9_9SPHN|nr:hemolysin family protein [Sandaracinobacter neustonicus]TPE63990.1 HlyC/CorC family transporter [Sandaracinobacter neustonicus]